MLNTKINAFDILGKKWNGEIIGILLEEKKPMRFSEISNAINSCSERVLTSRLKELEMVGIINRVSYPNTNKIEYALTKRGYAMSDFMKSIRNWEHKYL